MTNKPLHHAYHKIGTTAKDVSRIWMQGDHLAKAGFNKGTPYESFYNLDTRTIILRAVKTESESTRKVSGRKKAGIDKVTPIIELANSELVRVTQDAEKVRADFYLGEIHISIHHLDKKQENREQRLKDHLSKGYVTKGVLCSGAGISAAASHDGLASLGIQARTEFMVDREQKYNDIALQNNHSISTNTTIFEASLEELEPELLGFVDELHFSLPCSPHSISGKSKNKNQTAEEHIDATAVLGLLRVIDYCQPSVLYSENVKFAKNSATYQLLLKALEVNNYNVTEVVLDDKDTGSLESRPRWWFVATSKGLNKADIVNNFPRFDKDIQQLSDILEKIPKDSEMWKSTEKQIERTERHKANGNGFKLNLVDGAATKIGVMGKFYQKNRISEPHIISHTGTSSRLLTVTEMAKAQSVPLQLVENTIIGHAYEALGQGIDYRQGFGLSVATAKSVYLPLMKFKAQQMTPS